MKALLAGVRHGQYDGRNSGHWRIDISAKLWLFSSGVMQQAVSHAAA